MQKMIMSLCLEQLYALLNERFDARLMLDIVRRIRTGTALEMERTHCPVKSLYVDFWFGHAIFYCWSWGRWRLEKVLEVM